MKASLDTAARMAHDGDVAGLALALDQALQRGEQPPAPDAELIIGCVTLCLRSIAQAWEPLASPAQTLIRSAARLLLNHRQPKAAKPEMHPASRLAQNLVRVLDRHDGVTAVLDACTSAPQRRMVLGLGSKRPLSAVALEACNPRAALAAMDAEDEFKRDMHQRNEALHEVLFARRHHTDRHFVCVLSQQLEDSPAPEDAARLHALRELCWRAWFEPRPGFHLANVMEALRRVTDANPQIDQPGNWDVPFVEDTLRRLRGLGEGFLVKAVRECCGFDSGWHRAILLDHVLVSQHRPLLQLMEPVLPLLMRHSPWQKGGPGGWEDLARAGCDVTFWREVLQTLKRAGLDPCARIDRDYQGWRGWLLRLRGQPRKYTTLMHLVALRGWRDNQDCSRFVVLMDMGMDPYVRDSEGLTVAERAHAGAVRERWDELLRVRAARRQAEAALGALLATD